MKQAESKMKMTTPLNEHKLAKNIFVRWMCIFLAWLCLILGTIGLVVPGLPAFDFYFLAAVFAAKGSKRMHAWIVNNRAIAPILEQWQKERKLPRKVKIFSLVSMSIAACILIFTVPHPWAVAVIILIMLMVQLWMWLKA